VIENRIKFDIVKALNTISLLVKPFGTINKRQVHTPKAHKRLISAEDLLLTIRIIRGIFQKGSIIAAKNAILVNSSIFNQLQVCTMWR